MVPYDPNNFNPNNPIVSRPIPTPGSGQIVDPEEIKGTIDQSNKLNESLKNITQTLKDIAEAKAFGSLEEKLESYGKKLFEFEKTKDVLAKLNLELLEQQALLSNNAQQQDFITKINSAVDSRRKLGEETNKLANLELSLKDAIREGDAIEIQKLKDKLNLQAEHVDDLRLQQQEYKNILTDNQELERVFGTQLATLARQYINNKNLEEVYKDFIRNHQEDYDILNETLTVEERKQALALHAKSVEEDLVKKLKEKNAAVKEIHGIYKDINNALGFEKLTIASIIQMAFSLDKIYNEHAKQLGISKDQVEGMADSYAFSAASAGSLASYGTSLVRTNKNIVEASSELNKSLGTAAFLSKERVQDQVFLTKLMGLDVESATKVQHLSIVSGKSNKQVLDSVNNQVLALGKQKGIYLDNKQVLSDVAKVSGQLAAQYKNNPELLAKAVVQAKELGLTLQQTAAMGDKLLDFPSSIESELKAELLTGKALNLEQARYYALMGDSAKAAKELMNNVGGLEEFQKLNVIQQRAMAEAIGMQVGELSDSLKQQELLKKTGDASMEALNERRRLAIETGKTEEFYQELRRAGTSEEMIANQAKLAEQDKMNLMIEQLQELLSNLAQPLLTLVNGFAYMVDLLGGAKTLFSIIGGVIVGQWVFGIGKSVVQMLNMVKAIQAANAGISARRALSLALLPIEQASAVANVTSASAKTYGLGAVAIMAGIGAILGAVGLSGAFSGGGASVNTDTNAAPPSLSNNNSGQNITIQNKFQLNNRDLGVVSTNQQIGYNRKVDTTV